MWNALFNLFVAAVVARPEFLSDQALFAKLSLYGV